MRILIYIIITLSSIAILCNGCSDKPDLNVGNSVGGGSNMGKAPGAYSDAEKVKAIVENDSVTRYLPLTDEVPDGCIGMEINRLGSLAEVFNDSNYVHWTEAESVGIKPIEDLRDCWATKQPLEKITPCRDFYVEELRHSSPYLVPKAARMVHEIGRRFRDSLEARGGGDYRIKVTSVLRTPASVKRLQHVNKNSTDSSVHMLGTTIDISYARFICDDPSIPRSMEDLKGLLAEVLYQMREEGWCYVKYERKQPCFHISCRDYKF